MRALLLIAALTACNDHPPPGKGGRGASVDVDPRYGVPVDLTIPHLRSGVFGTSGKGGVDWFTMWLDAGYNDNLRAADAEFHVFRLDPADDFAAVEINPPEDMIREHSVWHAFQPEQLLLSVNGEYPFLYVYDGEEWLYVTLPSGLVQSASSYFLVDRDRLFATDGAAVAVWNGDRWRAVPAPAGSTLGPLERDRFRTVRPGVMYERGGPCTIAWDFDTLVGDAEVCVPEAALAVLSVNGSVDDFHVFDGVDRLRRFRDGAWSAASEPLYAGANLVKTTAPGLAVVQIPHEGILLPEVRGVELGTSDEVLFPATDSTITCECDRALDPSCPCVSPDITLSDAVLAADGETLDLLLLLDVNGERKLHARRFELPVGPVPFSAEDAP